MYSLRGSVRPKLPAATTRSPGRSVSFVMPMPWSSNRLSISSRQDSAAPFASTVTMTNGCGFTNWNSATTPSIRLHAACGFEMIGTIRSIGFKFGRWLDSVLMQRALGPGDTTGPGAA